MSPVIVNRILISSKLKLLVALFLVFFSSCDRSSNLVSSEKQVQKYLKNNHFEIPEARLNLPDFDYTLMNGQKEKLSDNKGKILLVNFWATWCFPCKQEMPDLEELKHRMKHLPFRILAINSGDKKRKIERFIKRYPYSFDLVLDENREISNSLNVVGLPTTYLLNEKLEVLGKIMGPFDWKKDSFIEFLETIVPKK